MMRALSASLCFWMTRRVASAAAEVTGFPPKVENDSGLSVAAIASVVAVQPIGEPFAIPLAKVMMSGTTP